MKKTRVLVVGDNSGHIPQILNYGATARTKATEPAFEVVGLVAQSTDLRRELYRPNRSLDAVFLASRNTLLREDQAAFALDCGVHVYSDKVIARDRRTGVELLSQADQLGVSLSGGSTVRFTQPVVDLSRAGCNGFAIRGGADPGSPHGGRDFYAVHVIDAAVAVAGPGSELLDVRPRGDDCTLRFLGRNGETTAIVRDSQPDGSVDFEVLAPRRLSGPVLLGPHYLFPLLHAWGGALGRREPLLSTHDNLLLIDALEALRVAHS